MSYTIPSTPIYKTSKYLYKLHTEDFAAKIHHENTRIHSLLCHKNPCYSILSPPSLESHEPLHSNYGWLDNKKHYNVNSKTGMIIYGKFKCSHHSLFFIIEDGCVNLYVSSKHPIPSHDLCEKEYQIYESRYIYFTEFLNEKTSQTIYILIESNYAVRFNFCLSSIRKRNVTITRSFSTRIDVDNEIKNVMGDKAKANDIINKANKIKSKRRNRLLIQCHNQNIIDINKDVMTAYLAHMNYGITQRKFIVSKLQNAKKIRNQTNSYCTARNIINQNRWAIKREMVYH